MGARSPGELEAPLSSTSACPALAAFLGVVLFCTVGLSELCCSSMERVLCPLKHCGEDQSFQDEPNEEKAFPLNGQHVSCVLIGIPYLSSQALAFTWT